MSDTKTNGQTAVDDFQPAEDEGLHNIKPLTDEDCDQYYKKMQGSKAEAFENICRVFVSKIKDMLKIVESKCRTDKEKARIAQINQLARLAPNREIFIRCFQKIWALRTSIAKKRSEWVKNQDYSHLIKPDSKQDMISGTISIVKDSWDTLTAAEMEKYWKVMQELLVETAKFIKLYHS